MATWKKVLFEGTNLTSTAFAGNTGDLNTVESQGISGGADNVLLGTESLDIKIDFSGVAEVNSAGVNGADYILIQDVSDFSNSEGNLRKATISQLQTALTSDVSTVSVSADETNVDGGSTTSNAQIGGVNINLTGGEGITTELQGTLTHVEIQADRAVPGASTTGAAQFGSVLPHTDFFELSDVNEALRIKENSITATEIDDLTITNDQIAVGAAISDTKLATIDLNDKVRVSALRIDGAQEVTTGLSGANKFVMYDATGTSNAANGNVVTTLTALTNFVSESAVTIGNAHPDLDAPADIAEVVLEYVDRVEFDDYGHVTAIDKSPVPVASINQSGIINDTGQSFGGIKTFQQINTTTAGSATGNINVAGALDVAGNAVIHGNLTVEGDTVTLNTATLNVEDKTIVGAVVDNDASAHPATQQGYVDARAAAQNGGFTLQSHHGSEDTSFAGLRWGGLGGSHDGGTQYLTGWTLNDTATAHEGTGSAYDATQDQRPEMFPVAIMEFETVSSAGSAPATEAAGVGSFHFNTADQELYIRVA